MGKRIYNGDIYDTTNRISDAFFEVNSCGVHRKGSMYTVRRMGRLDYHIIYVEKGNMDFMLCGEKKRLSPGGFLLYLPHEEQDYCSDDDGLVYYWAHFSGKNAGEVLASAGLDCVHFSEGKGKPSETVVRLFEKMLLDAAIKRPCAELLLSADMLSVIASLGNELQNGMSAESERIAPAIAYIQKNFSSEANIGQYAAMCCLSVSRFSHLFKEITGKSPYSYQTSLRMTKAAEMLLLSDAPVGDIAASAGYADPLYFSRAFRKYYGASPEKYRKRGVR
ncbi:MAG: helix-turn-helix domain-containing protein [Eubacteriales bacterium]